MACVPFDRSAIKVGQAGRLLLAPMVELDHGVVRRAATRSGSIPR